MATYALKKKVLRTDVSPALWKDFRIGGKYEKVEKRKKKAVPVDGQFPSLMSLRQVRYPYRPI